MLYVYDIILNWSDSDKVYDFFEWEINDELERIKKIPLFKINADCFNDLLNYEVKVSDDFLLKIHNLTEVYSNNIIEKQEYVTLFSDGSRVIAVEFNYNGEVIYRSSLLLDEEEEATIISNKLAFYELEIKRGRKRQFDMFLTRLEKNIKKLLTIEINNSYKNSDFDKLKYLYYECFGKEQNNIELAYKRLLTSIDEELNSGHNRLYEIIKLSYRNKV